nr:structure-specific endonuclease subunit slx1 [Quercus suber]
MHRWAWQNTHLTRHVEADSHLDKAQTDVRSSPKPGRVRKQRSRPSQGLSDRLANLHLLLRAHSFERWPLKVTFYSEDVFRAWTRRTKQQLEDLRSDIEVTLDDSSPNPPVGGEAWPKSTLRILNLDVGYGTCKPVIEKRRQLLNADHHVKCGSCGGSLDTANDLILACPGSDCDGFFHLDCLSTSFLQAGGDQDALVPLTGRCLKCNMTLQWTDLVKELSLFMRGHKVTEKLFKKPRSRKAYEVTADAIENGISEEEEEEDDDSGEHEDQDQWQLLSTTSEDEEYTRAPEARSMMTAFASYPASPQAGKGREQVIEDSDWDEAEVNAAFTGGERRLTRGSGVPTMFSTFPITIIASSGSINTELQDSASPDAKEVTAPRMHRLERSSGSCSNNRRSVCFQTTRQSSDSTTGSTHHIRTQTRVRRCISIPSIRPSQVSSTPSLYCFATKRSTGADSRLSATWRKRPQYTTSSSKAPSQQSDPERSRTP